MDGAYPEGWLFIAHQQDNQWIVAFEGEAAFPGLTSSAPASVVPAKREGGAGVAWARRGTQDRKRRRSGPGTNYGIAGTVPDGNTVSIACSARGTSHTGRFTTQRTCGTS